jgi:glycosyltransferase involved in cell wall biosynthesis
VQKNLLRICLISREYPPDTGFGGIATFTKHLAHGLVSLGHEVHVVTLAKVENRSYIENGITVHRVMPYFEQGSLNIIDCIMPYSKYMVSTSAALWEKFFELHKREQFDVVDTPELLAEGIFPALASVCPLVIRLYTPHSKFIAEKLHNVTPSFDHQFVAMIERVAMKCADSITSPSKDLAQFVSKDINCSLDQIKIIPNPIDADVFTPHGELTIKQDSSLNVLFVGRLEERKGIRYLIEAWKDIIAAVPQAHLYVIGDDTKTGKGQTSVLMQLKKYLEENKLNRSITFIDRIPLGDLPAYYRSANVCVVPSVYDNSPYTCLEAMSCGSAVIGTTAGGTSEYIVHGESGIIVEPRNPNAIAEAVISLLKDKKERERIGGNARSRVLLNFQRREVARKMVQLYQQAIESFSQRQSKSSACPIYPHSPEKILSDMEEVALNFNESLHQFLFQWSYTYRVRTWYNKLRYRPRLYLAKLLLRVINTSSFWWTDEQRRVIPFYRSLEDAVIEKEAEVQLARRKYRPVKC